MKFLIIQRVNTGTPVTILAKLTPAQLSYIEELQHLGTIETYYHLVGQQGHMLIVNVQSENDLSRIIGEDPLFFYSRREVYPLTTLAMHKEHFREIVKD